MISAVTAASSATGRSDVPADAIATVPFPRGRSFRRVMARAMSWYSTPGTSARTASQHVDAGPCHEQRRPAGGDARRDGRDLRRCLPQAENDLRKALADRPVVVHPGESEVFEGLRPKFRQ